MKLYVPSPHPNGVLHFRLAEQLNEGLKRKFWMLSGLLFGLYHVHQPWGIPGNILSTSVFAFAALRFRSTWFSIVLHTSQSALLLVMIPALVLGAAP